MSETIEATAERVAADAVARGQVDGVQVARALPLQVVPDLVGWPAGEREHLLRWAAAEGLGPVSDDVGSAAGDLPAGEPPADSQ